MAQPQLGRTLVVANPVSHSGKGAEAAERVRRFFEVYSSVTTSFEMVLTQAQGHATSLVAQAHGVDTLLVLGGDGVIHEAVNGIMSLPRQERPALAIIPMGSGNDFARTLGATFNDPERSLAEILSGTKREIELGRVTSDADKPTHFMQTLSFGLDAAIALDTTDRRATNTSQEGSALFATSGVKIMASGSKGYASLLSVEGEEPQRLQTLVMAIQNGPSYGGGFRVCPDAIPTDGLLDICYNKRRPSVPHLLGLFGLARLGLHTRSSVICVRKARHMGVEFTEGEPPCQVDGERLRGTRFEVHVVPRAIAVVVPGACKW